MHVDIWDLQGIDALNDEQGFGIRTGDVAESARDCALGCLALAWERPPSKQVPKEKFTLSREPVLDAIAW